MFFIVRVRFLAGYRGREWPPSPARLFKAFVAVSRNGLPGITTAQADEALRWIEGRAPILLATRASEQWPRLRRFVPNNSIVDPKTGEPEWPTRRASKEEELIRSWHIDAPCEVAYAWEVASQNRELAILQSIARRLPSLGKGEDFVVAQAEFTEQIPGNMMRYEPGASAEGFTLEVRRKGA